MPAPPPTQPVDPAVLDACFERACSRPEVQAAGLLPPLPDEVMPGSTRSRFCAWLCQYGTDERLQSSDHPLWAALVEEGLDSRWTIDTGPPGNDGLGFTVLHVCCTADLAEALRGLSNAMVQRGQPLDVLGGPQSCTPLAYAVSTGGLLTSQALLDGGANALGDAPGGSLLWAATTLDRRRGHEPSLIKLLLDRGAGGRIDEPGDNGLTPLHQAVRSEREPSVMFLLNAGADPRRLDPDRRSARDLAYRYGLSAIAQRIDAVWVRLEREALNGVLEVLSPLAPNTGPSRPRPRL